MYFMLSHYSKMVNPKVVTFEQLDNQGDCITIAIRKPFN